MATALQERVGVMSWSPPRPDQSPIMDASVRELLADIAPLESEWHELNGALSSTSTSIPRTQRGVYGRRKKDIERQLSERYRLLDVYRAGYDECNVPAEFALGFVETPSAGRLRALGMGSSCLVFNAPIPEPHLGRYVTAKGSRLFDAIMVASSDAALFRQFTAGPSRPKGLYVDPIMVGFISLPSLLNVSLRVGTSGRSVSGGRAFLITQWDLSKDLPS